MWYRVERFREVEAEAVLERRAVGQYHLDAYDGGIFPVIEGIRVNTDPADQFMGIAELTFSSIDDRATWFEASTILMDDEHNIFRFNRDKWT